MSWPTVFLTLEDCFKALDSSTYQKNKNEGRRHKRPKRPKSSSILGNNSSNSNSRYGHPSRALVLLQG